MTACPVCKEMAALDVSTLPTEMVKRVTCPRCGTFEITQKAWSAFKDHLSTTLEKNRYLLSGRTRVATLHDQVVRLDVEDFGRAERDEIPHPEHDEKIRLMLDFFERRSTSFGQWLTTVSENDYPAAFCRDRIEWTNLIWAVVKKDWLEHESLQFRITLAGKDKLRERPPVEVAEHGDYWSTYPEADLDALTKLIVRGRFNIDLERSFAGASETSPVALLFVDIDHFKKINDEHGGHAEGDRVLGDVAEILRSAVGRRGLVYRYGGEEITVILPGFSESEAAAVAERLRESVERVDWRLVPSRSVTVSIGVAGAPDGKISSPALFCQHADRAMYSAKKNGRNRVALARAVD